MREIKRGWIFLLLLTCALALPACGEQQVVPEQEEGVLTYAALDPLSGEQKMYIQNFNNSHTDVQIEVLDYSGEGGVDRLLTELALGKVPDIMELRRHSRRESLDAYLYMGDRDPLEGVYWMPYRQMARKGYLEDLWPYIENDPDLGREGVLEAPLKAAEVDGGLYMLFSDVYIYTLIGAESVVGDRNGWTLEELLKTFSTMPEGSTILRYNATRREMYTRLFCTTLDRYINWETGQCSFDNDEFRSMLGFLETFPTEFKTALTPSELNEELTWRRLGGKQMLEAVVVRHLSDISFLSPTFGRERAAYVGFPATEDGSGSFLNIHGTTLAMSSTCQNKEAAWEFMSYMIRTAYTVAQMDDLAYWNNSIMIPVNRKSFENGTTADLRRRKTLYPAMSTFPGGPEFEVDPPAKEDLQRFEDLINSTTQLYWPDDALSEIVWEAIGPYFAGDKTMDETIQMVQNRVALYVNENR